VQISIFAVGRMKKGAEQDLTAHYLARFAKIAPSVGLGLTGLHEIVESRAAYPKARMEEESDKMLSFLPQKARLIVLDEGGRNLSSTDFANMLQSWRDGGIKALVIALGGPDGHANKARERADCNLAFGAMTWPHQIARLLLAEQLYRAATILSGHPYHRPRFDSANP